MDAPKYPHFVGFRLFVSALAIWVMSDSWNTIRGHRRTTRENRRRDEEGLAQIERTTVKNLAAVAEERSHILAWQQAIATPRSGHGSAQQHQTEPDASRVASVLVADGVDPYAQDQRISYPSRLSDPGTSYPSDLSDPFATLAVSSDSPGLSDHTPASTPVATPTATTTRLTRMANSRFGDVQTNDDPFVTTIPAAAPPANPTPIATPKNSGHPLRNRVRSGL